MAKVPFYFSLSYMYVVYHFLKFNVFEIKIFIKRSVCRQPMLLVINHVLNKKNAYVEVVKKSL